MVGAWEGGAAAGLIAIYVTGTLSAAVIHFTAPDECVPLRELFGKRVTKWSFTIPVACMKA